MGMVWHKYLDKSPPLYVSFIFPSETWHCGEYVLHKAIERTRSLFCNVYWEGMKNLIAAFIEWRK